MCQQVAEKPPNGLPEHQLLLIVARLADTLDSLPLHEVSPDLTKLLSGFFEEKWSQGKLSELWGDEDEAGMLQLPPQAVVGERQENLPADEPPPMYGSKA